MLTVNGVPMLLKKKNDLQRVKKHIEGSIPEGSIFYIFTYSLRDKEPQIKIKFSHQLEGRDGRKGLLQRLGGRKLGRGSVMVPEEGYEKIKILFDRFKIKPYIMKVSILEENINYQR